MTETLLIAAFVALGALSICLRRKLGIDSDRIPPVCAVPCYVQGAAVQGLGESAGEAMAVNVVTVTVTADVSPADVATAEGNIVAVPSGTMWPDTSDNPIVPMVVHAQLVSGTCSLALVATDNYSTGVLTWDFIINIRGIPTINVPGCAVDYANGATQSVWTILQAAGWTPLSVP